MASQVFAIQELFEQIMLDNCISLERLFILQRVSRLFKATITISFYLQGKMRLRHLTHQEHVLQVPEGNVISKRPYNRLETRPYLYTGSGTPCTMNLSLNTDMASFSRLASSRFGIVGRKRIHTVEQSWSQMRLAFVSVAVHLDITVKIAVPHACRHPTTYHDLIGLRPEDGTLGNFVKVLQDVAKRSYKEHLTLAYEAHKRHGELAAHIYTSDNPARLVEVQHFASVKVFADSKLMERILRYLDVKQLFVLRRLSPLVKDTIEGSPPIRQVMQLRQCALADSHPPFPTGGVAIHMLEAAHRRSPPYGMSGRHYSFREEKVTLFFIVSRNDDQRSSETFDLGLPQGWNEHPHTNHQLWRNIMLSPVAVPVVVEITVKGQESSDRLRSFTELETVEFASGDGTLGQLLRLLNEAAEGRPVM